MSAEGYHSQPISDSMEVTIRQRLVYLKNRAAQLQAQLSILKSSDPAVQLARLQGNIGALEWLLGESDNLTPTK